nr:hypothetical protein [uncultured Draconibacterium sp.]
MKTILTFLLLFPVLAFAQTENNSTKKWNIGAHFVHRSMNSYEFYDGYSYPRLSAEYSFTKCTSAELMVERIGKIKTTNYTHSSYAPISIGYKLNVLPCFTKNEWLVNNLKVYNSIRYSVVFSEGHITDNFRYAPGIDCYIYKNFGINTEFVFGQAMKTTFAVGIKYRF